MKARSAAFLILTLAFALQTVAQQPAAPSFAPLEQWRAAIDSGDSTKIAALLSKDPAFTVKTQAGDQAGADAELQFWSGLRKNGVRDLQLEVRKSEQREAGQIVAFQASFSTDTPVGPRSRYLLYQQLWKQQEGNWRLIAAVRSDLLKIRQPRALNPKLYDPDMNAAQEIQHETAEASKTHRRLILVFGGNWCYDCHVLDGALHEPSVAPVVEKNFIVIHVDIGREEKKNADLVKKYNIPLDKGVPALAVLESDGRLLYSQQNGEFESARSMDPDDLLRFLNKWKPTAGN